MSVKHSLAPLCQMRDLTGLIKNPSCLDGSSRTGVETVACKFIATLPQHCAPTGTPRSRLEGNFTRREALLAWKLLSCWCLQWISDLSGSGQTHWWTDSRLH